MKNTTNILLQQISRKLENLTAEILDEQLIWLYDNGCDIAVKTKNLLYCESRATPKEYTHIFFTDELTGTIQTITSSYGIGKWEAVLSRFRFCRIHRSYLVNYNLLTKISRLENMAEMERASRSFAVSRTGKKKLQTLMEGKIV